MKKKLILASGSPRRKELLQQLGYTFSVCQTQVEEVQQEGETAIEYVSRLSVDKALAGLQKSPESIVLGSDTIVVIDEEVLEKPDDLAHCKTMLLKLAGRQHQVITAVTVISKEKKETKIIETKVWFKPLSEQEIEAYWQTGEPCDKAGSYGIQGLGGRFVTRIEGSYHAVMGLPLYETDQLLSQFL